MGSHGKPNISGGSKTSHGPQLNPLAVAPPVIGAPSGSGIQGGSKTQAGPQVPKQPISGPTGAMPPGILPGAMPPVNQPVHPAVSAYRQAARSFLA